MCLPNNLALNIPKTREMIVSFRKQQGTCIVRHKWGHSGKCLPLNYSAHTSPRTSLNSQHHSPGEEGTQMAVFPQDTEKSRPVPAAAPVCLSQLHWKHFHFIHAGVFVSCTAADRKALQRVVKSVQQISGTQLPSVEDIYRTQCLKRATNISRNSSHPSHHLFTLLPSRRC